MGQVLDRFHGKQWRQKQIRFIADKVYERIKNHSGRANLTFEDLYIAVLLVYNDINKRLPGPHFDPPSKDQVRAMMQAFVLSVDCITEKRTSDFAYESEGPIRILAIKGVSLACDINLDGELDHEEFVRFIQELTTDTFIVVSQGLIITLVVAPTVAMATKKATEGVPAVGKVVKKLPNSVYASLVTLAIVWFQTQRQQV